MNSKITLTGDQKIMNMQKLGTVSHAKLDISQQAKTAQTSMDKGLRAIHYTYLQQDG